MLSAIFITPMPMSCNNYGKICIIEHPNFMNILNVLNLFVTILMTIFISTFGVISSDRLQDIFMKNLDSSSHDALGAKLGIFHFYSLA